MSSTMTASKPNDIFSNILQGVTNAAVTSFEEIAPIWASKVLDVEKEVTRNRQPTFQESTDRAIGGSERLTTQQALRPSVPLPPVSDNNKILLLVGVGFLAVLLLRS